MKSQSLIINHNARLIVRLLDDDEDVDKLSWDDAIQIILEDGERQEILYDYPYVAIELRDFCRCLKRLLSGKLELDEQIWRRGIGYCCNIYCHDEIHDVSHHNYVSKYIALETPTYDIGNETWLYSISGVLYMEVTKQYKWICEEEDLITDADYIPFDEFMRNYPPGVKYRLEHDRIREWVIIIQNMLDFY